MIPEYIKKALNHAISKNKDTFVYPGFYRIWDNKINTWLCNKFGLSTGEQERYNINNAYVVFFDWNLQIWYVGV
jgi:hypothetical protein